MEHGQFDKLARWLYAHARDNVPMPLIKGTKQPLFKHAGGVWTWERCQDFVEKNPAHSDWCVLLRTLCAVDFDDHRLAQEWEARYPELLCAPMQLTKKGRHYLFRRPDYADAAGFFDGARQAPGGEAVDFKTLCATDRDGVRTGGVLAVAPSPGKSWAPGEFLIGSAKRCLQKLNKNTH